MKGKIGKVAVLGAGVMGSTVAAHLANVRIPTYLLDIVPKELTDQEKKKGLTLDSPLVRNRFSITGKQNALKLKPNAFYVPEDAGLITVGNLEDNLDWLGEADWIIEVVVENLKIKQEVFKKIAPYRKPGTIVSSNTSGISINQMCEGLPDEFRQHFLGTHFFNPPRYMKLLEIIPAQDTLPEVVDFMTNFASDILGKGVVFGKDTMNFIANRIGIFSLLYSIKIMLEDGYKIEEIDKIAGPALGRPKSAVFRTADLVGLDIMTHVAQNAYDHLPNDEKRDVFKVPDFITKMLEKKWLGAKTKQGFYKKIKTKEGSEILALDHNTLDYRPQEPVKFGALQAAKNVDEIGPRTKGLVNAQDRAGQFAWKILSEILIYSAHRIPEIADDIVSIDNAMKWGFNWELGPFETWDAIGVAESVQRMQKEGKTIPPVAKKLLESGKKSFYKKTDGRYYFFDVNTADYKEIHIKPRVVLLPSLRDRQKIIISNPEASLIDLGDEVACLEFHSKMNAIGPGILEMVTNAVKETEKNFKGMVIGNQGRNFSVGANLMYLLLEVQDENWDELDLAVRYFQKATMTLKYSEKPVVAAPFGLTLGGGAEMCLGAAKVRASAETYIGLVELAVGLIPAAGGTKEMLLRSTEGVPADSKIDLTPFVQRAFETIGMAKVATSAREAQKLGFLRPTDGITVNPDYLIHDAKQTVLAMAQEGYTPPQPKKEIRVVGETGLAALKLALYIMKLGHYISDYDQHLAGKLAYVLSGGNVPANTKVTEQYILDLEREVFLSLAGEPKTQARMEHMLNKGKPLRN